MTDNLNFDVCMRDACSWDSSLNGMIGVFVQDHGDNPGVFLACTSSMPDLATELVRAIKSDVAGVATCADFCTSKEMWFLENINRRNRLRLIAELAEYIDIQVPTTKDTYSHTDQYIMLAVESCGIPFEHVCQVDSTLSHYSNFVTLSDETGASVCVDRPVIRHYKGCVDAGYVVGPVPIFLGNSQGILVLLPINHYRENTGIENDHVTLFEPHVKGQNYLIPVVNVWESRMQNIEKIQEDIRTLPFMRAKDILHHHRITGIFLPQKVIPFSFAV